MVYIRIKSQKNTIDPSIPLITSQSHNLRDDLPTAYVNSKLDPTSSIESLNFDMPILDILVVIRKEVR